MNKNHFFDSQSFLAVGFLFSVDFLIAHCLSRVHSKNDEMIKNVRK
jgi:hypothetical protein